MIVNLNCYHYDITIVPAKKQETIKVATYQPDSVAICFSKNLEWAKDLAEKEAKKRFNKPVIILVNSVVDNKKWIALKDDEDPVEMSTFTLMLCMKYRQSDIIIFSNNPAKEKLLTPRVWYFEQNIFIDKKLVCSIWKAVSQWGYTLEK
jgi:hypothetical protein